MIAPATLGSELASHYRDLRPAMRWMPMYCRATTRKFVVAGQFIEALRCFENGMTEEVVKVSQNSSELS